MSFLPKLPAYALLLLLGTSPLVSCQPHDPEPAIDLPPTPATAIPDEFVGTWFAKDNRQPLTTHWEQGTAIGELGFRDFRTMVFTKDGRNAEEYATFTVDVNGEIRRRFYKFTGTLEYRADASPRTLTFHAQHGTMRLYVTGQAGYQEAPIVAADVAAHHTVWQSPAATSFPTATNYLTCQRLDGGIPVSAEYEKVNLNAPAAPSLPSTTPPATGTHVKIGDLYYATATIGAQEWTTMNYAGPGGLKDADKPQYGTFLKSTDLAGIGLPAGWRVPTKQDYIQLLAAQGIGYEPWDMTPENQATTQALGRLMAPTGWRRVDGYATNASGFTGLPANIRVLDPTANPQGEGSNCILWTSERDAANNWPITFKIIQRTTDTYASLVPYAIGTASTTPHIPVRFVRDK